MSGLTHLALSEEAELAAILRAHDFIRTGLQEDPEWSNYLSDMRQQTCCSSHAYEWLCSAVVAARMAHQVCRATPCPDPDKHERWLRVTTGAQAQAAIDITRCN